MRKFILSPWLVFVYCPLLRGAEREAPFGDHRHPFETTLWQQWMEAIFRKSCGGGGRYLTPMQAKERDDETYFSQPGATNTQKRQRRGNIAKNMKHLLLRSLCPEYANPNPPLAANDFISFAYQKIIFVFWAAKTHTQGTHHSSGEREEGQLETWALSCCCTEN